ncbi:TPA: hypothetical protein H3N68_003016 [Listeria monocytogenes]|nr:hypothetical protein [Listeria monocytogenes]
MKNKTTKKIICGGLATVLLSSSLALPTTALASTSEQMVQDHQQEETFSESALTELDNLTAGKYITFDSSLKQYKVNSTIGSEMTPEKIEAVNKQVAETNNLLALAKKDSSTNIIAVTPKGEETVVKRGLLKGAGVNRVTYHWNYARIRLSKNTVRTMGAGLSIAGIWLPLKVVSKVCASLGVGTGFVKHGIWFDYNYFSNLLLTGYGWQ